MRYDPFLDRENRLFVGDLIYPCVHNGNELVQSLAFVARSGQSDLI